jgi:hypothetical protein
MDGVEGPDPDREQRRCLVKDTVVDPDKIQPREHLASCGDGIVPGRQEGPQDLSAGQGTGNERAATPQVSAQGC